MMISSPSQLRQKLEELGIQPKKSLSQNFLIDKNILHKIIKCADVQPGDLVIEIGAGPGALTEVLLQAGAEVIAIEKDRVWANALKRLPCKEIFEGDVRDYPFENLPEGKKIKVVANLPYHLTSVILSLLLPLEKFSTLTLMVQEEVAVRMTSKPGSKDFSSLTVFLDFYATSHISFVVSNRSFYPVPKVQSAVVHLQMRNERPDVPEEDFFSFVRAAFQKRRKMLRSSLSHFFSPQEIVSALEQIGCRKEERPENLGLNLWISLYRLLKK